MTRRTKTIIATVAATLVATIGVTAPALGSAFDAGKGGTGGGGGSTVVTPDGFDRSICC